MVFKMRQFPPLEWNLWRNVAERVWHVDTSKKLMVVKYITPGWKYEIRAIPFKDDRKIGKKFKIYRFGTNLEFTSKIFMTSNDAKSYLEIEENIVSSDYFTRDLKYWIQLAFFQRLKKRRDGKKARPFLFISNGPCGDSMEVLGPFFNIRSAKYEISLHHRGIEYAKKSDPRIPQKGKLLEYFGLKNPILEAKNKAPIRQLKRRKK